MRQRRASGLRVLQPEGPPIMDREAKRNGSSIRDVPGYPETQGSSDPGCPGILQNATVERSGMSRDIPRRKGRAIRDIPGHPKRNG